MKKMFFAVPIILVLTYGNAVAGRTAEAVIIGGAAGAVLGQLIAGTPEAVVLGMAAGSVAGYAIGHEHHRHGRHGGRIREIDTCRPCGPWRHVRRHRRHWHGRRHRPEIVINNIYNCPAPDRHAFGRRELFNGYGSHRPRRYDCWCETW